MPLQMTTLQLPVWTPRGPGEAPRDPTLGRLPLAVSPREKGLWPLVGRVMGSRPRRP